MSLRARALVYAERQMAEAQAENARLRGALMLARFLLEEVEAWADQPVDDRSTLTEACMVQSAAKFRAALRDLPP